MYYKIIKLLSFLLRREILFSKRYLISKLFFYLILRMDSSFFMIHIKIKYSQYNY